MSLHCSDFCAGVNSVIPPDQRLRQMSLYSELRRRSVIRVAIGYLAASWLLVKVADKVFPLLGIPDWSVHALAITCALGFLPALIVSWILLTTPPSFPTSTT